MSFPTKVKEDVLVACARHCCSCHKATGSKIELHHLIQSADGGEDTFENAIPLCFECHADAGHYNDNHPKGTKFSIGELRKARDSWYKMVAENKIPTIAEHLDDLNIRYIVSKEANDQERILAGNYSSLPVKNPILVHNNVLKYRKKIKASEGIIIIKKVNEVRSYKSMDEYFDINKDSKEIDKSSPHLPMFYSARIPNKEELLSGDFNISQFEHYLIKTGSKICDFFRVFVYDNHIMKEDIDESGAGCGSETVEEERYSEALTTRNIWLNFLAIENTSSKPIILNGLLASENTSKSLQSFTDESNSKTTTIQLPGMKLQPGSTVVIPVSTVFVPFENLDIDELETVPGISEWDNQEVRLNGSENHSSAFLTLGPVIKPKSITYTIGELTLEYPIQKFDLSNLYAIREGFAGGSCPHLFYITRDNKIVYVKELFTKSSMRMCVENLTIPSGVHRLVIAEIEDEKTIVSDLTIGSVSMISETVLNNGDTLELAVLEYDQVNITGRYITSNPQFGIKAAMKRQKLISQFMYNFYHSLNAKNEHVFLTNLCHQGKRHKQ